MTVYITLTASTATGPFDLYQNSDLYAVPFATNVPRSSMVAGYSTTIDDASTIVKVQSTGICQTVQFISIANLPSPTPTQTPTQTQTPTRTATPTQTPTNTGTPTQTPTNTSTQTPTPTNTPTPTRRASGTTEAEAYLTAVVDAGGTGITSTVSAATITLFTSLVSNNLYSRIQAMYPMLGGNSNGCKFNAVNPLDTDAAFRLTFNGGWTYNASGATSNGTNAYADTYLSGSSVTYGDNHLGVYMSNNNVYTGVGKNWIGSSQPGSPPVYFTMGQDGTPVNFYGNKTTNGIVSVAIAPQTSGFNLISSSAATMANLYRNGSLVYASSGASGTINSSVVIAALNNNNSIIQYYDNQYSFAIIGKGLTTPQQATLATIINTFQTTLSRNTY